MEMVIDGERVDPAREYTFPKNGNHIVFIKGDYSFTLKKEAERSLDRTKL